jgi:CheY-like chemotaxis protein
MATVLMADDNPEMRLLLTGMLQQQGHMVIEAADGDDLLYWAMEENPDVILVDLQMPKMGEFQVLETLKADDKSKDIPVIVISASQAPEDISRAHQLGAHGYIPKPWSAHDLASRIDWALTTKRSG